jgi:hypothetical protein
MLVSLIFLIETIGMNDNKHTDSEHNWLNPDTQHKQHSE